MSELQSLFDYDTLTPAVREMVQEHTGEIRRLARRTAEGIVEIGQRLAQVRESLDYGEFDGWLKTEFDWSRRAAYNFIKVAETFGSANFAQLDIAPSALYALASGSTPDFIREELVEISQATGTRLTNQAVKERLAAHRADTPPPAAALLDLPAQETPVSPVSVDNAEMARKKKGEGGAVPTTYKGLQYDFEDVENARGELVKMPVLPDVPKVKEIKSKNFEAAATRFETTAASTLTLLGKLATYTPEQLKEVIESPEGRQRAAGTRVKQLRKRLLETLAVLDALSVTDDEPAPLELPAPKEKDKSLNVN